MIMTCAIHRSDRRTRLHGSAKHSAYSKCMKAIKLHLDRLDVGYTVRPELRRLLVAFYCAGSAGRRGREVIGMWTNDPLADKSVQSFEGRMCV